MPVLVCPEEVAAELVVDGIAEQSRNPSAEFAATDWLAGILMFTGAVSDAITIKGEIVVGIRAFVQSLHRWNERRTVEPAKQTSLTYRTPRGKAQLDLNEKPSLESLQSFVEGAYDVLESEISNDDS